MSAPEKIRYGCGHTSVGDILVATSDAGLVAVLIREKAEEDELFAALQARHPGAELRRDPRGMQRDVAAVRDFVEHPSANIGAPLDIRGTDFQRKVWDAVLEVPFAETTTFAVIAAAVGSPRAVRAVGSACTRNPLEFAIPCHRVLRSNGAYSGGSAWGDRRQAAMVQREAAAFALGNPITEDRRTTMSRTLKEKRARFRELHQSGCFILPNPWDVGSARMLEALGFEAVASTSTGYAWSTGRPDYAVTRDDQLEHLAQLSSGVNIPVNADYESGFGKDPEGVAESVSMAIAAGVSGLSIEDRVEGEDGLHDLATSVERLKAARKAIDESGEDVVLVARTEGLLIDGKALKPAIEKLVAFADAGADCLYAPGVWDPRDIAEMVRAVAPKPVNVLMLGTSPSLADLADLGVRRVSVGGTLARVAWSAAIAAASGLKDGRSEAMKASVSAADLNAMFHSALKA